MGWMTKSWGLKIRSRWLRNVKIEAVQPNAEIKDDGAIGEIELFESSRGYQAVRFTQPEFNAMLAAFGPPKVNPEVAALETLASLSDTKLCEFLERLYMQRRNLKEAKNKPKISLKPA